MRHLLSLLDLQRAEVEAILATATDLKSEWAQGVRRPLLERRVLGLLFEKPSLRTRVSFESGIVQLGGSAIYLGQDVGWGERETIADFGRVLSQYVDLLVFRGKKHTELQELAKYCAVPVINGLTDYSHPCQALADVMTMQELNGPLRGQKLTYVGDGNNVLRSLVIACAMLDVNLSAACPVGYRLESEFLDRVKKAYPTMRFECVDDPKQAVRGANAVYTDVWASMGQEAERDERRRVFASYQVNADLMSAAGDAIFLHCLPAHRGEEVTSEVIDSERSAVVQQAANRMHVQKGVMVWLLNQ